MDQSNAESGEPLSKQISLSKLTAQLETSLQQSGSSATSTIRNWYKNYLKLYGVRKSLQDAQRVLAAVVGSVGDEFKQASSFEAAIGKVQSKTFLENLSAILAALPRDPNVKLKQPSLVRVMASAVLICFHPGHMLSLGAGDESTVPDTSVEALQCTVAARLTVRRLLNLLNLQLQPVACSMRTFRRVLLGFRFSFRLFVESLDVWKQLDADRMVQSMQAPYMFCYGAYLSALNSQSRMSDASGDDVSAVVDSARGQLERMRLSMVQVCFPPFICVI